MVETRAKFNKREEQCKLEAMSPEVMEHILKHCDYCGIDALRKTCKSTRRLVELIKPAPQIKTLKLNWRYCDVVMRLEFCDSTRKNVTIQTRRRGFCSVSFNDRFRRNADSERFLKNACPSEIVQQDLKILLPMLARQRTPLELFEVELDSRTSSLFQTAMEVLAGSRYQLRIKSFSLEYQDRPDLMKILPLLCATTLKSLSITEGWYGEDQVLDLSQVAELAQWKSLSSLSLIGSRPDTLCRLGQIRDSYVSCKTVPPDQFVSLKEMLRNNATFKACKVNFSQRRLWREIRKAFSPTYETLLYFSTSTPGFVLRVTFSFEGYVTFMRVRARRLNPNVVVRD